MERHIHNYLKRFKLPADPDQFIFCEHCEKRRGVEFHHIEIKGMGCGKERRKRLDEAENIILLCNRCHKMAHSGELDKSDLKVIHGYKLMNN